MDARPAVHAAMSCGDAAITPFRSTETPDSLGEPGVYYRIAVNIATVREKLKLAERLRDDSCAPVSTWLDRP